MKRNKSGISLIVLVITVIVMIILAGSVIISLSNSGIIGKANEAVDANNLKQVQQLAALAWSEAYIDKMQGEEVDLEDEVIEALTNNKVDTTKYIINVTDNGVEVLAKTLGNLIKSGADYGKKVDYSVTVGTTIYSDWQVLYEDEKNGYVFLITEESVAEDVTLNMEITEDDLSSEQIELYKKYKLNNSVIDIGDGMAQLISDYGTYANTADYGEYVIGAIGGPTLELFVASWNAKGYTPTLSTNGGDVNGNTNIYEMPANFLMPTDYFYWLASMSDAALSDNGVGIYAGSEFIGDSSYIVSSSADIRPVVCLSSDIPAEEGTTTDFSLIK